MGVLSLIRTLRKVDQALQQSSSWRANATDRAFLDEQIRATQLHVVNSLINGLIGTWFTLDAGSAAVTPGTAVCMVSSSLGTVTKALAAALTNAGIVCGIVMTAAQPGSPVWVAWGGVISNAAGVTGLATGAPGPVRVNTGTALLQQVGSFGATDYPVGFVDNAGNLTITLFPTGIAAGGTATGGLVSSAASPVSGSGTKNINDTGCSRFLLEIQAMTGAIVLKFPPAPTKNQSFVCPFLDQTFSAAFTLQINGNGKSVVFNGQTNVGGASLSPILTPAGQYPIGYGEIEWIYDGTLWVAA